MLPFAAVVSVEPNAALVVAEPVAATQWQYRGDDGWVDFDSDSCATLSTVVGETQLVIGDRVYSVDAERTFQTNPVTGYRRAIRRAPYGLGVAEMASARAPVRTRQPGAHAGRGVWEWQKWANGPWAPYDRSTNAIIVAAYGRGEGSVVAVTNHYRHNVDFGRGTAKDLTTGAIHAIRHAVDGVPVADAPPQEPTPELQRRVHELVRGMRPLHGDDALAYSRSLTPQQASTRNNRNLSGWHMCVPVTCVGFTGCVHTYNFSRGPNENTFCFPCFLLGFIAIPLLSCCCSSRSEREQNAWIERDAEHHDKIINYIVIVDHERGTLAHYGIKRCSAHIEDRPQCYCVKV